MMNRIKKQGMDYYFMTMGCVNGIYSTLEEALHRARLEGMKEIVFEEVSIIGYEVYKKETIVL